MQEDVIYTKPNIWKCLHIYIYVKMSVFIPLYSAPTSPSPARNTHSYLLKGGFSLLSPPVFWSHSEPPFLPSVCVMSGLLQSQSPLAVSCQDLKGF